MRNKLGALGVTISITAFAALTCLAPAGAETTTSAQRTAGIDKLCVKSTWPSDRQPATVIGKEELSYPRIELDAWSEGHVLFLYTIAADGSITDIVTLDRMGSEGFVARARDALRGWRYRPAMLDGKAVPQYGNAKSILFIFADNAEGDSHKVTSADFSNIYRRASADFKSGHYADAIQSLSLARNLKLGLFEQTMGAYLTALSLQGAGPDNWHRALTQMQHAALDNGKWLEPALRGHAIDFLVKLQARDGNYVDAVCTSSDAKQAGVELSTETVQLVEKIRMLSDNPAPIATSAQVFASEPVEATQSLPPAWIHTLSRDKFSFSGIKGNAKNLKLVCTWTMLEAPIDEETQWSVPPNAGRCLLFVFADPGTTFQLIEGG